MKRILGSILAILMLLSVLPAAASTVGSDSYAIDYASLGISFGITTTSAVNVRRTPRSNGQVVGSIRNSGTPVIIIGSETAAKVLWYAISYDGQKAYVRSDMLSMVDSTIYLTIAGTSELGKLLNEYGVAVAAMATVAPRDNGGGSSSAQSTPKPTSKPTAKPTPKPTAKPTQAPVQQTKLVWIPTNGGTKYHSKSTCSNMKNPTQVDINVAKQSGFTPCSKCYK